LINISLTDMQYSEVFMKDVRVIILAGGKGHVFTQ